MKNAFKKFNGDSMLDVTLLTLLKMMDIGAGKTTKPQNYFEENRI